MTKYIELNTFLKIKGLADTGGKSKVLIRSDKVKVNDVVETRNKRKLFAGDKVEYEGQKFVVEAEVCLKEKEVFDDSNNNKE
jgi:ribosome-associated protein